MIALLAVAGMILGGGVACGGRAPAAKSPGSHQAGGASQGAAGPGQPAPGQAPAGQPAGPDPSASNDEAAPADAVTEAECQALVAHVVAVANAAHVRTVAPEHAPTAEQLAEIRARMAPELVPMCLSFDRPTLACQMRAQTRDELLACQP